MYDINMTLIWQVTNNNTETQIMILFLQNGNSELRSSLFFAPLGHVLSYECVRERERESQGERKKEREKDRARERQDREKERKRERQRERERERERGVVKNATVKELSN
jgi:hypothetical protein